MSRPLRPEDLYAVKTVDDPQVDSEGARIAYVQTEIDRHSYEYRRSIWVVSTRGGEARRFTGGPNDTTPRWSPDGSHLAFLRAPSGELKPKNPEERDQGVGKPQIWMLPADGGEARQLTFMRHGAGEPVWSPDGKTILFSAEVGDADDREAEDAQLGENRVPYVRTIDRIWHRIDGKGWTYERRSHLFALPVAGGETRQLTDGDWDDLFPVWSPDGHRIAFTSDRSSDRWKWPGSDVWVLELMDGNLRRLTDETLWCWAPGWSPNGGTVAFTAEKRRHSDGHTDLFLAPPDGGFPARRLTDDFVPTCADTCLNDLHALEPQPPRWSADGREIFFLASARGTTHAYAANLAGTLPRQVTYGNQHVYAMSMDRSPSTLALGIADPMNPGDLFVQLLAATPTLRRLTEVNRDLLSEVPLGRPDELNFKTTDGLELQGWVLRPAESGEDRHVPAVLDIHGGPMAMYGWSFSFRWQMLASNGYGVIYGNPRGSTGYGRVFSGAVICDWGGKDYEDLMTLVDVALQRGGIDADRLGVMGGSYGGYMTSWAVGHTARFKAAVTSRPVINLATFFGTSDFGLWMEDQAGALPWENLEKLMERSPITYVANVRTPVLIIACDNDLRCPITESEQFYTALKYLGREVKMLRFEGQSHAMSVSGHPRSRVLQHHHVLDWFSGHIPAGVERGLVEVAAI